MTRRRATGLWALFASLLAASAAAAQTWPDTLGPRVRHYSFYISLPDSGSEIHGIATIAISFPGRRSDTLRLDLVGMVVDSVSSGPGTHPVPVDYDGKVLRVPLWVVPASVELPPEASWDVRVFWHGVPRDGLIIQPNARGRWSAFGDDWPERARDWIPTVDDPADKAPVSWIVSAPADLEVVANGALRQRTAGGGRVAWTYREDHPIPTYTMVIGATHMTVSRRRPAISGADTIPIEVWAYPEDSAFADSVPFRRVTQIVETLQRLIGPFPYEKLAHVESSTRYGGMENSSAIFYPEQVYVSRRMGEGVVRHETAHQWFGDAVTERDFHHLWLSEGFATFYDLVVGAALDGDSVYTHGIELASHDVEHSGVASRPIIDTTVTDLTQLLNENNYQKGALVLHMLREYIGRAAFLAGMRDYYRTYRDSSVLSDDFERVMERAAGRKLDWFFGQWLRQPGYPQLDVAWSYDSAGGAAVLDVAQVQPADWGTFRLPNLTLDFLVGTRLVARRVVEVSGARQTLRVDVPAPTGLRVDPDGALLLTATVRKGARSP